MRPSEWPAWANKGHNKGRAHENPPFIDDPADIGIQICKWWDSLKPTKTDGVDAWANVRKGGKHGLISLMMLMLWWGRAAAPGPAAFRSDSRAEWLSLVQEVTRAIDKMMEAMNHDVGSKRPLIETSHLPAAKRYVFLDCLVVFPSY